MSNKIKTIPNILKDKKHFDLLDVAYAIIYRSKKSFSDLEIENLLEKVDVFYRSKLIQLSDTGRGIYLIALTKMLNEILYQKSNNYSHWLQQSDLHISFVYFFDEASKKLSLIISEFSEYQNSIITNPPEKGSTVLTNVETALFFLLLQKENIIDDEITKINLSKLINALTGFGQGNMKTILSDIETKGLFRIPNSIVINNLEAKLNSLKSRLLKLKKQN